VCVFHPLRRPERHHPNGCRRCLSTCGQVQPAIPLLGPHPKHPTGNSAIW
jgi:hypothetical protein